MESRASEMLAGGRPTGVEAVLEDGLEAMAEPDTGARLYLNKPHAHSLAGADGEVVQTVRQVSCSF